MRKRIPIYETTTVGGVEEQSLAGYRRADDGVPRDTRLIARRAMFVLAVLFTLLAMGLTVAAVGTLFSTVVPGVVAFPGATLFDLLWAFALLAEWMSATRPKPRRAAQWAGIVFVALSMAAVVVEAHRLGHTGVGVVLAAVPAAVKGAWWLLFAVTSHPLPDAYQNRLDKIRSEIHTDLAVEIEQRELDAARNLTARLRNLRAEQVPAPVPPVPEQAELTRVPAGTYVVTGTGTTEQEALEDAQRTARELGGNLVGTPVSGEATPTELVRELIRNGATDTATIRNRLTELGSVRVPSDTYIRRLLREAKTEGGYA